jgi:hypothetical protein
MQPDTLSLRLGRNQIAVLVEAASEVAAACPWLPISGTAREVASLARRGAVARTHDLFAITPRGCLILRRTDHALARRAVSGLRRERAAGSVMPWEVAYG